MTLQTRLRPHTPGLTSRAALDKFAAILMPDVHFPTTDGRPLLLSRYTQAEVIKEKKPAEAEASKESKESAKPAKDSKEKK